MRVLIFSLLLAMSSVAAETNVPWDGHPWNVSTGNLSVSYIQACPMGAFPRPGAMEAPPSADSLRRLRDQGLVGFEDYVGWGAVERAPGIWDWTQHDAMEKALHGAGLKYVVYDWVNFPPLWLRNQPQARTLMQCAEHGQETFYLSAFDPRTVQWFDHFYKNLHEHFGNRIDDVYACVMGPYGEGNYPLSVDAWVNMGHCHEGYWCNDSYAIAAFRAAMKQKYARITSLDRAWDCQYKNFGEVEMPSQIHNEKFVPSLAAFPTSTDKRRWLDFIAWYHQAIIDFAEQSVKTVLKYFPASKVRLKPGGSAGGVNPIRWGTYCPGYAKMAGKYHIVLQPADCMGAVFADKWVGTAYQFYGVKEGTEPAGNLSDNDFVRRMFCDASAGASQFFSYEYEMHAVATQKYISLITGHGGDTDIAVYCPTTLYRFGESLQTTISSGAPLRDLCEFDVLDELLIGDGALSAKRYKVLLMFEGSVIDRPILDRIDRFEKAGGRVITVGHWAIHDVEGRSWNSSKPVVQLSPRGKDSPWKAELTPLIAVLRGVDGKLDGLWTCRRGRQVFVYNSTSNAVPDSIDGQTIEVAPHSIWIKP